ncbi:MAG: hypothetical protein OHK0017_06460 [Patescibacteria group bacterium]
MTESTLPLLNKIWEFLRQKKSVKDTPESHALNLKTYTGVQEKNSFPEPNSLSKPDWNCNEGDLAKMLQLYTYLHQAL